MIERSPVASATPPPARPMLSRIKAISFSGMRRLIVRSTSPNTSSLDSNLVPAGSRTCSRNCPASTVGKKSCPIAGMSTRLPATKANASINDDHPVLHGGSQDGLIPISEPIELGLDPRVQRPEPALFSSLFERDLFAALIELDLSLEHVVHHRRHESTGEERYDARMAKMTASASGRKRRRGHAPLKKKMGTNTMQIDTDAMNAGAATWEAASMIACRMFFPSPMLR